MKHVPLTRGLFALCDDEDFEGLSSYSYYAHVSARGKIYAARKTKGDDGRWHFSYMHHDIMGKPQGLVIDHKDGNPLNNRRDNLRICTQRENIISGAQGRKPGVFTCKQTGRFGARVRMGDRRVFLGRFDTFEEAAAVVKAAQDRTFLGTWTSGFKREIN